MRISSIQLAIENESKPDVIARALSLVEQAGGSDLILLPEMWPCGYFSFDRYASDAEPLDGPLVAAMACQAKKMNAHLLMGSFPERDGDQIYNSTVLFNPQGEILARYRKMHLFSYQSQEHLLLTRGNDVVVATTPWGRVGIAICYDLRFPELFRKMVEAGAEMFLIASAWPAARLESWRLFNRARAAENLAYLISCNCAGTNNGIPLAGHSMIVAPTGEVLAEADERESILRLEIDPSLPGKMRREFPALSERILF